MKSTSNTSVMAWGVGGFAQGMLQILREDGADVATYLTRDYGHYSPSLAGPAYAASQYPDPCQLLRDRRVDFVIPMSIDWAGAPWVESFRQTAIPIFCPVGQGMRIERERDFARQLCRRFHIPFPASQVARNRLEAESLIKKQPRPYVIKNPLCSPTSPIHTIVCETLEDTQSWLPHLDYAEGVFLQEYLGRAEAGHIALVSGGEIHSLVTNQEYKRAFNGNMGIVAGAPLGGLIEQDPNDRYGLARELLHPLLPWFREVNFHGPIQVTAVKHQGSWKVIEYNIRMGVTCSPVILRLLKNPTQILADTSRNKKLRLQFRRPQAVGCSVTLAGFGYPYTSIRGPLLPIELQSSPDSDCDIWWNEVTLDPHGRLFAAGHRVADIVAVDSTVPQAIAKAYDTIRKIRCLGSYYRTDIGQSLWPPGNE